MNIQVLPLSAGTGSRPPKIKENPIYNETSEAAFNLSDGRQAAEVVGVGRQQAQVVGSRGEKPYAYDGNSQWLT